MLGLSRTSICCKSHGYSIEPIGFMSWLAGLDVKYRQAQKLHSLSEQHLNDMGLKICGGTISRLCSKS